MTRYDYLIIGGGIAGVTAAETIREHNPGVTIGILSDEPHLLYSRVLLPHYLKKRISRGQLFLRKADDFTKQRIDLRLNEKVVSLDCRRREVFTSGSTPLGYDKLLIASGGKVKPWGRAEDSEFIYRLQTLDDTDRLYAALADIKIPLVVGGSFISLEFLDIFTLNGILPTLIFRDEHFFGKMLDSAGADLLRGNFERNGIRVQAADSIEDIGESAGQRRVLTKALREIRCDAVAVGVGLERNLEFIKDSGVEIAAKGVRVDEFLQTNQEGVFAAGDVAEFYDIVSGRQKVVGNWTNSFLQGKRAALNMFGTAEPFRNVAAYSITNLGLQITSVGDYDEEYDAVSRIDPARSQYERFFLKEGILMGAVLINRFQDKTHITRLIENRINVGSYYESLQDFKFDIHGIAI